MAGYSVPHIMLPFMQCEICNQVILSVHAFGLEIISACAEMIWQCETSLCSEQLQQWFDSYHTLLFELLLVDMDHNIV